MTNHFDYYAILGLKRGATADEIAAAYAALTADVAESESSPQQNGQFERLRNAYEVLSDPQRRETYDLLLSETAPIKLDIKIRASRDRISLGEAQQLLYFLVEIFPPTHSRTTQLPLNLCLVIDRSTSMDGERLKHVKTAVDLIVEKLTAQDMLSIVSFSDRAEVVVPATAVADKSAISRKVRHVYASGGTEIYQGLRAGYDELTSLPIDQYANHLILLTDGHTYGDADECLMLANQAAVKNIGMSAFGIGSEWNDQFLDRLVSPSGGQSGFIEAPEQIITFLQERIQGLGRLFAHNMRLAKEFPSSVHIQQAFKLLPFAQPLPVSDEEIQLGDVEVRAPLSFLLEVSVDAQPIETRINIPFTLTATIPAPKSHDRSFKQQYQLMVTADSPKQSPPEEIVAAVRVFNMYQLNEKVHEEVEAGELDMATTRMRYLTTRLLESGQTQLAHQAHEEANRLAEMGTLSTEGRKRLKYGTRALINQTINLPTDD